jgi:hypothetical protein
MAGGIEGRDWPVNGCPIAARRVLRPRRFLSFGDPIHSNTDTRERSDPRYEIHTGPTSPDADGSSLHHGRTVGRVILGPA